MGLRDQKSAHGRLHSQELKEEGRSERANIALCEVREAVEVDFCCSGDLVHGRSGHLREV
jgi:hypothetical protein